MRRLKESKMPVVPHQHAPRTLQSGVITRIENFGLGYVKADTGQYYTFQFDKIENYGGEAPRELGLRSGSKVLFAADGPMLVSLRKC